MARASGSPSPMRGSAGQLSIADFYFCGILGEGQFGRVMMARNNHTSDIVAVKVLRKGFLVQKGSRTITHAISEKQVLQEMADKRHPYIIGLLHSFQDDAHLYLVMDFIGGGDLFSLIEKKRRLPEAWARIYSAEIALALEHLHGHGVIYRDLKPENVMVGITGHLKLTDFGFAKKMNSTSLARGSCVGTPEYMAPELLQGREYGVAVDWWTLGCLLYEMVVGRGPFASDDLQLLVKAITSVDPHLPSRVSAECSGAIRSLMSRVVEERFDGTKMRSASFYQDLDWAALLRMEIEAPYTPVASDVADPDNNSHAEQRARLQAEFGDVWSSVPQQGSTDLEANSRRPSHEEVTSSPRVNLGSGTATGLAMELTSEGSVWRVSNQLAELFGFRNGQGHMLFGLSFLDENNTMPPCMDAKTLPPFADAFHAMLARLKLAEGGDEPVAPPGPDHHMIRMLLPGGEGPLYLLYAFDETSKLTDHSVALMPTHEGHAAITVSFADVTRVEAAKELVRKRYKWSYNEKRDDASVASILSRDFSFNTAGTQMPLREGAHSRSPVERYLERRALLVRAFPDIHYEIVDQSASDERVVTSWHWSATHLGPFHLELDGKFRDIAPTGQRVLVHGVAVDVCSEGVIVDHAAYYDVSTIMRQIRQRGDGIVRTPPRALEPDEAEGGEESEDPQEAAAEALMETFYTRKVLSLLATACNDLGFAICRGCSDSLLGEGADLPIAVSSVGFARALGLSGPRPGLNVSLLAHLRAHVCTDIQPDTLEVVEMLRDAARHRRHAKELVTLTRADRPHALIVSLAPFRHEELDLVAVVIIDVNANPNSQEAREAARHSRTSGVDTQNATDTAAMHYTWQHELLGDLSAGPGAHLGFCSSVLSAALHAFTTVGFSLAVRNTPGLPMTWVSQGFLHLTGYTKKRILNRNCNRLQSGATDPDATLRLSEAIRLGRAERVTLWNVTADGTGFWNCLSMYPSLEHNGTVVQYYVAAQVRMAPDFYKRLVRVQHTVGEMAREAAAAAARQ